MRIKSLLAVAGVAIVAALLFRLSDDALAARAFDEDYYNECTLKNVKPGMDRSANQLIVQACIHKATPKKCRGLPNGVDNPLDPFADELAQAKCVEACKNENYFSRTFGDCSTG
jgi:hypothetical protein